MPVKGVLLTSDAYSVCLAHALTTEKEEIMGLLIGEIDENRYCHISAVLLLRRSDKQADRVEISPEQLSDASSHAENLSRELERPMRVVGWYHSHPHITVWPSRLDVRTQADYQLMDEGFVGLIFSVFNHDKVSKNNRIQVCCFQSVKAEFNSDEYERLEIPLRIEPQSHYSKPCIRTLAQLPEILSQEEDEAYVQAQRSCRGDLVSTLHNGSVFTENMSHICEGLAGPLMQQLETRFSNNEQQLDALRNEKERLKAELKNALLMSPVKSTAV